MIKFAEMSRGQRVEWLFAHGVCNPDPDNGNLVKLMWGLMDDAVRDAIEDENKKKHWDYMDAVVSACDKFQRASSGVLHLDADKDDVNHPAHYTYGNIEVIDYIEDKGFPYHLGNAVKYISRAGRKDPEKTVEDLQKAAWYIERYITLIQEADAED